MTLPPDYPYPLIADEIAKLQQALIGLRRDRDAIDWRIIEAEKRIKYLMDLQAMNETYVVPH
jgi:hypothetical protein